MKFKERSDVKDLSERIDHIIGMLNANKKNNWTKDRCIDF